MKRKVLIILLSLIFIYCIGGVIYSIFIAGNNTNEESLKSIISVKNYKVDENKINDLYKKEFEIFKNNLESKETNFDDYINSIAKLYIIDLYSLKGKVNKYDISASQYVYENAQENFKLKVSETLYKYIEDNSDNNRQQELPNVTAVTIESVEKTTYIIDSNEFEAYIVSVNWEYEKDLGYDTSALLTLIKKDTDISVVEQNELTNVLESNE